MAGGGKGTLPAEAKGGLAQEARPDPELAGRVKAQPGLAVTEQPSQLLGDLLTHDSALGEIAPPAAATTDEGASGHRARLRARFMAGGPDALPDYELIEMILFRVFARGDTKPLAKRLVATFGSFAEIINAPIERLLEVQGLGPRGAEELKLIRAAAVRLTRGEVMGKPVLNTWHSVLDYCRATQGFDTEEKLRLLFLDKRNQLVADEIQSTGTIDHTPVYIREVVHRALTHRASAVILVHNHPSGDPTPSRADIIMTKAIADAGRPLGLSVHDHIIVSPNGHASFRALNLL